MGRKEFDARKPLSALTPLGPDAATPEQVRAERHEWFVAEPRVPEKKPDDQKLHRITNKDRRKMDFAISVNRRRRAWHQAELDARAGPQACRHCGREPCGLSWPDARCCHRCTHEPMRRWALSHVLYYRQKPFFVMEVETGGASPEPPPPSEEDFAPGHRGRRDRQRQIRSRELGRDAIYYRADGVVMWVRRGRTHYFLGARVSIIEFSRQLATAEEKAWFAASFLGEVPNEEPFEASLVERTMDEDAEDVGAVESENEKDE